MGHSDVKMLRHYQEIADTLKQDAADRMNALLGS